MKTCLKCRQTKSLTEFHLKRNKPQAQCKACRSAYMAKRYKDNIVEERAKRKEYYSLNRDKIIAKQSSYYHENAEEININRRLRKYGLSREQFLQMINEQNGKCANKYCISDNSSLAIDHCHFSNNVRGILCDNCNTALGLLKDSMSSIEGLKTYLMKYKK